MQIELVEGQNIPRLTEKVTINYDYTFNSLLAKEELRLTLVLRKA